MPNWRRFLSAAFLVGVFALSSCNIQFRNKYYRPKPKPDTVAEYWSEPRDIRIGRVTFVDQGGFVLVENPRNLALPVGQKLHGDGAGGRSTLTVSTERSRTHLSADISAGGPQVGDEVVYRHRPGHSPSATPDGDGGELIPNRPTGLKSVPLDLDSPLPPLP